MANIITRVVRLLLDRNAAKQTEEDAKKTIGGVEQSLGGLKKAALAVGAALAAAFGVRALINFGREAVRQASESEREWANLAGTVDNVGQSFEQLEPNLRALADAFESATVHGDDDFARTLSRLITLTGKYNESVNNMGLVANVAAKFFNGELAPAVDLVAKVMNGNTAALQRMGISVKTAQEGLDVLNQKSFGEASRQANTFGGRLAQLSNQWGNFQKALGNAIIESGEGVGVLNTLIGVVQVMIKWVNSNTATIQNWVTTGLKVAIAFVDGLYRALFGLSELVSGVVLGTLGLLARGTAFVASGYAVALEAAGKFLNFIGAKSAAESVQGMADRIKTLTDNLDEFGRTAVAAGTDLAKSGFGRFTASAFGNLPSASAGPGVPDVAPMSAGGGAGAAAEQLKEKTDAVSEALKKLKEDLQTAHLLSATLGDGFNLLAAEASALESALTTLAAEGSEQAIEAMPGLAEQLAKVKGEMKEGSTATEEYERAMATIQATSQVLGGEFDAVGASVSALEQYMIRLTVEGETSAEVMEKLADRLSTLKAISEETSLAMQWQGMVAGAMASAVGAAMGAGLGPFAKSKAKQNLLEALELKIRSMIAATNPVTAYLVPIYAAAAGMHAKLGIAWGALAAVTGGFGGGGGSGGAPASASAGGGGSASLGAARSVSGPASERAQAPANEVHIHFVGEGFSAVNPEVQRVVIGAVQESRERYGKNARIYTHRRSR